MSEEVFRPRKGDENKNEQLEARRRMAEGINSEVNEPPVRTQSPVVSENLPFQIKGNVPPEILKQITGGNSAPLEQKEIISGDLKSLLEGLKSSTSIYEEIILPSRGVFYDGNNGPSDGILHIKPMTGEEEQILATPRFVRKGQALNMIFSRCIQEKIKPEELLTIDRTYILIYLRGISYSTSYDVEIKCPECERKFSTEIDLNSLLVETCPDNYGPQLQDVLPTSKYKFRYRLSKGRDETDIQDHRDKRIKNFGDNATDDTLTYRTSLLLEEVEGVTDKRDLQTLVRSLPISDVSYIRNLINDPPFGVNTKVDSVCPSCLQEFELDLPLETSFFFPRQRREKTQA